MPEIDQTVSHYRIVEKIGQGGMGEVYLADDTTLDRKVALKFLPEAFTSDPERMARFEREAKLLASLNHPNIAGIHGLEQSDGTRFLVLEYVEGETLQARLSKGSFPLEDALAICRQIAEGLEAAHEKGVIHRDLKPANVMITAQEKVKILDFGLAKALADGIQSVDSSHSPTITDAMTRPGVVLGTAAYMSPEQAKGKAVDKRADIWAFGCILYECLTGKKAFEGETVTETLAAVIKEELDLEKIPAKARPLLLHCIVKDPQKRLRHVGDAIALLEFTPEIESISKPVISNRFAWGVAILAALTAVVSITLVYLEKPQEGAELRYLIDYPDNVSPGNIGQFALSPDGRQLAFLGTDSDNTMLWLRRLDSFEARPLPGTELSGSIGSIFWSPDSRFIALASGNQLIKVDVSNGSVRKICDLSGIMIGGSWNRDGVILFNDSGKHSIMRVSATSGKPSSVMKPDPDKGESIFYYPVFLPDDSHFLYFCGSNDPETRGIYIGNLDAKPEEQIRKKILDTSYSYLYVSSGNSDSGYLLTMENRDIVAKQFDPKSLEVADISFLLAQGAGNYFEHGFFSASNNGVLVYREVLQEQFQWLGRDGTVLETVGEPGSYETFDLSRDASQLVVGKIELSSGQNLWHLDMSRKGLSKPLTFENVANVDPRWSRDGDYIIFGSTQDLARSPFKITLPSLSREQIYEFKGNMFSSDDISPDDEHLLYHDAQVPELWALPLTGEKEPIRIAKYPTGTIDQAQFSPDGRFIAFNSNESGRYEVKVVPFPPTGEEWQISAEGGVQPTWQIDGRELYFLSPDGMLMAVDILPGETFEIGNIQSLFPTGLSGSHEIEEYAPDPSGERFLALRPVEQNKDTSFKVIHNWTSLLEQ